MNGELLLYKVRDDGRLASLQRYWGRSSHWSIISSANRRILLYDSANGKLVISEFDSTGRQLKELKRYDSWKRNWTAIVPFRLNGKQGFLFYNKESGDLELYTLDAQGALTVLKSNPGWKKGWTHVISGQFYGIRSVSAGGRDYVRLDDEDSEFVMYSKTDGILEFYRFSDAEGSLRAGKRHNTRKTWDIVVSGDFGGGSVSGLTGNPRDLRWTDLLLYDRRARELVFYTTFDEELRPIQTYSRTRTTWDQIIPGNFRIDASDEYHSDRTDLFFYENDGGIGKVFALMDQAVMGEPIHVIDDMRTSWAQIIPVNGLDAKTALLFYDRTTSNPTLDGAKARLRSLGIDNLDQLGSTNLRISQNLLIDKPGVILAYEVAERLRSAGRQNVQFYSPPAPNEPAKARVTEWPDDESVIISPGEIDLTVNKKISVDIEKVKHLWIIARRIKAGPGSVITYHPLENPRQGDPGEDGHPNPAHPSFDPSARQSSSLHTANKGGNGAAGKDGGTGPKGLDAPDLDICVLEVNTFPDIILPGQRGGRGGKGGRGADGGNGQRGRNSRTDWAGFCSAGPGIGGDGGSGGDGGRGGKGGRGGRGAKITISTLEGVMERAMTARRYVIINNSGQGGPPGSQGDPGNGGEGGWSGKNIHGFVCEGRPERRGANGQRGNRTGDLGEGRPGPTAEEDRDAGSLQFKIITEDDFNQRLAATWLVRLDPASGIEGTRVTVYGQNLTNGIQIIIDGKQVPTTFLNSQQITFTIPSKMEGGRHLVRARSLDGEITNDLPFRVKPSITSVKAKGSPPERADVIAAGDTIIVTGTSFDSAANAYDGTRVLSTKVNSSTELEAIIPSKIGLDPGGVMQVKVRNSDGFESNIVPKAKYPSLDSGFRAKQHGYAFENFSHGSPSFSDFAKTFGEDEVAEELVTSPVLTGSFMIFFLWFLNNNGHCSGLSAKSLEYYHNGGTDLYSQNPVSDKDPPPISAALKSALNIAQGRVLSSELITHYGDQSQEGLKRVEKTVREIEQDFLDGLNPDTARTLCFIPRGDVWGIIADESTRKAFFDAHCVVPTRIVYPSQDRRLNGARLYVYDNNAPGNDSRVVELFEVGGMLNFKYKTSSTTITSDNTTLGTAPLKLQLLDDVDLPTNLGFIVDMVMSPARIRVEDDEENYIGYKNGKMHLDPKLGLAYPWLFNYLLIKPGTKLNRHRIVGYGDGAYSFKTIQPNGKSITIANTACSKNTDDSVQIGPLTAAIQSSENKMFDITVAEAKPDGSGKSVNFKSELKAGEKLSFLMDADVMDGLNVKLPNRDLSVALTIRNYLNHKVASEKTFQNTVPAGKSLQIPRGSWANLSNLVITPR